jgi:hypothetical protein
MSDKFILGACLIGVILAVAWAWADYIEKKDYTADDIDLRLSKLRNERKRQNKCVYCGNPLEPDRRFSESVCPACAPPMPDV